MSKNQTVIRSSHIFSLFSLKPDCYYKSITADFTPPPSLNTASNSIIPAYLQDRNFFTPGFIVPRQKEYYHENQALEKEKFQTKINRAFKFWQDSTDPDQDYLRISPPVPSINYCQICKKSYTSYQEHAADVSHLRQARFSKANKYIFQLSKLYNKKISKTSNKKKKQQTEEVQIKQKKGRKSKKNPRATQKKLAGGQQQTVQVPKNHNFSTNLPSILPTPY